MAPSAGSQIAGIPPVVRSRRNKSSGSRSGARGGGHPLPARDDDPDSDGGGHETADDGDGPRDGPGGGSDDGARGATANFGGRTPPGIAETGGSAPPDGGAGPDGRPAVAGRGGGGARPDPRPPKRTRGAGHAAGGPSTPPARSDVTSSGAVPPKPGKPFRAESRVFSDRSEEARAGPGEPARSRDDEEGAEEDGDGRDGGTAAAADGEETPNEAAGVPRQRGTPSRGEDAAGGGAGAAAPPSPSDPPAGDVSADVPGGGGGGREAPADERDLDFGDADADGCDLDFGDANGDGDDRPGDAHSAAGPSGSQSAEPRGDTAERPGQGVGLLAGAKRAMASLASYFSPRKRRRVDAPTAEGDSSNDTNTRASDVAMQQQPLLGSDDGSTSVITAVTATVRVTKCVDPFHVDVSGLRSFYEKVEILPPIDSYDEHFSRSSSARSDQDNKWFVSMGDIVAIEIEQANKTTGCVHYPFKVSWAPAEIVSIYQVHESRDACLRLRHGQANGEDEGEVLMEVRWLYRPWEVPGAKKAKSPPTDSLLEVFETDQVDTCPAESILSPVQLHDSNKRDGSHAGSIMGMPLVHFHCQRLWSVRRSTFVPSGALGGMASRGRMHSSFGGSLKKLQVEEEQVAASSQPPRDLTNWEDAFRDAIQKLSIAEAAQDTQDRGMVLPGRESERKQISSFLRNAIRGVASGNDYGGSVRSKSSTIFIAGPPGTGKTATVKSLVHELKNDQYEGILPEFNFVSVNGMECKTPYDAYVKFWEELRREKLASQDAVHELENYFCGDGEKTNSVIVLLIDEIDYLNTNRETVLYNFFDWPLRATRARLVVIGISNTIDLPERLQPRVQSRIGGTRCNYQAYDVPQTIRIIKSRLGMSDESTPRCQVFDEDAIKFAAKKTANLSGDIRKAFRMCKAAAEAVYNDHISSGREPTSSAQPLVRIHDIQHHCKDAYTAVLKKAIRGLSVHEALLMVALGSLKNASDSEEIYFDQKDLLQKIRSMASASGERMYTEFRIQLEDVSNMVTNLAGHGLVAVGISSNPMIPYVKLDLDPFEIATGLRDTRHSRLAEKWLPNHRLFG